MVTLCLLLFHYTVDVLSRMINHSVERALGVGPDGIQVSWL